MFEKFLRLDKLIDYIVDDQGRENNDRFAARFILVDDLSSYQELLKRLTIDKYAVIKLSSLTAGDDTIAETQGLAKSIAQSEHKFVTVIPLSEHIKICPADEKRILELSNLRTEDNRRVYIPLFDFEHELVKILRKNPRFSDGNTFPVLKLVSENSGQISNKVIFVADGIEKKHLKFMFQRGLKNFYCYWERPLCGEAGFETQFADGMPRSGRYSSYSSNYDTIKNNIDYSKITCADGSTENWTRLAGDLNVGEKLSRYLKRKLNVYSANIGILSDWLNVDSYLKWLSFLFLKNEWSYTNNYFSLVLEHCSDYEQIWETIDVLIFEHLDSSESIDYSSQQIDLLKRVGIEKRCQLFWNKYDQLTKDESKLICLSGISHLERSEIIGCFSKLLSSQSVTEKTKQIIMTRYPQLINYYYSSVSDNNLNSYLQEYKHCKITDKYSDKLGELVRVLKSQYYLWNNRNDRITKTMKDGDVILWLDGIGCEWLGFIREQIFLKGFFVNNYEVARANLPSDTDHNRYTLTYKYHEYKDFDKYIHDKNEKFPQYIADEFEIVARTVEQVSSLLENNKRVIISSDHGSTRMVLLNKVESVSPPENYNEVKQLGRACTGIDSFSNEDYGDCIHEEGSLYFASHRRFRVSANLKCEVHGGATPEEVLVPIIVVAKSAIDSENEIRTSEAHGGILRVTFSYPVSGIVELEIQGKCYIAECNDNEASFDISGLRSGQSYDGRLKIEGENKTRIIRFTIQRLLKEKDMGI